MEQKFSMQKSRKSNFELLRIVAMVMIVFHHIDLIIPGWSATTLDFKKLFGAYVFGLLGKAGVDLFALITGYFMYSKKIKGNRFFRVLIDVDFYGWLTLIVLLILGISLSLKNIISFIFPVLFSLRWYATAYLILYLLLPYINLIIKKINIKEFGSLLLILMFVLSIMPTLKQNVAYSDVAWITFGYLVGAFIAKRNRKFTKKMSMSFEWIALLSSLTLTILSIFLIHIVALKTEHLEHSMDYFFIQNSSVLMFIFSVSLFLLFERIDFQSLLINKTSKLMFGVYLSHAPILKIFPPKFN